MRSMIIFIILFTLTLVGCQMEPNYVRPEQPGAEAWHLSSGISESIANLPWWNLLWVPALQDLIRTALAEQAKQTIMKTP